MADDMEEVTQRFTADMAEYSAELEEGVAAAEEFAAANEEAKAATDGLQVKIDELKAATAYVKIDADDKDGLAKMAAFKLSLDELSEKVATPNIDVQGLAKAQAELLALDAELDGMSSKTSSAGEQSGQSFGEGFSLMSPQVIIPAIMAALAVLPALMAVAGAGAGIALGAAFLIATNTQVKAAATSMVSTLKGVMTEATQPMIAPLEDAFKQIGQYAKEIEPQLRDVFATVAPMIQPLVDGLESLVGSVLPGFLDLLHNAMPAVQALSTVLGSLGAGLDHMFQAMAPGIAASSQILVALGSILGSLLPLIGTLATSMATLLAPVFSALATVIGVLAPIIGELVTALAGALAPVVTLISTTIGNLARAVLPVVGQALVQVVQALAPLISALVTGLAPILPPLITAITQVAKAFLGGLVQAIQQMMPALTQIIGIFTQLLEQVIIPNIPAITKLGVAFVGLLGATAPMIPPLLQLVAVGLQFYIQVLVPLTPEITKVITSFTQFVTTMTQVITMIASVVAAGLTWISSLTNITSAWSTAHAFLVSVWNDIVSGVTSMVDKVDSFFQSLPGKIVSALGNLGTDMFNAGAHAISMLISGLESIPVVGTMVSIAGDIADHLPHSPAKKGPLSGAGSPDLAGRRISSMLAGGIAAGIADVRSAIEAVTGAAAFGSHAYAGSSLAAGAVAPAGGGTSVHVTVPVTAQGMTPDYNDPRFLQYMQSAVQEATLRYGQTNPGNGFTSAWGR